MARRKAAPNIPADTLARARSQASLTPVPTTEANAAAPTTSAAAVAPRPASKRVQDAQFQRSRKKGDLDNMLLKERLMHPTVFPTGEDLRHDYSFVVKDLRNMFLLSGVLMVLMVAIATLAP